MRESSAAFKLQKNKRSLPLMSFESLPKESFCVSRFSLQILKCNRVNVTTANFEYLSNNYIRPQATEGVKFNLILQGGVV